MKKLKIYLPLVFTILFTSCSSSIDENFINQDTSQNTSILCSDCYNSQSLNLDMEVLTPRRDKQSNWVFNPETNMEVETTKKVNGSYSLLVQNKTGSTSMFHNILDAQSFKKKVKFSGYISSENLNGIATLFINVLLNNGENRNINLKEKSVRGTTGWQNYSIEADIGSDVRGIVIGGMTSGTGKVWFDSLSLEIDGNKFLANNPSSNDINWIKQNAIRLKTIEPGKSTEDLQPLKKIVGNSQIVMLGESTHGTKEFFRLKHRMLEFLVKEMGFNIFAIEDDMVFAEIINEYVLNGEGDPKELIQDGLFFPWQSQEFLDLIKWIRNYNKSLNGNKVKFTGIDSQKSTYTINALYSLLSRVDKEYAQEILVTLNNWESLEPQNALKKANDIYNRIIQNKTSYSKIISSSTYEDFLRYARLLVQSSMTNVDYNNNRDKSMAENIEWLLNHNHPNSKILVWVHDGHIGRDKNEDNVLPIGAYLNKKYSDRMKVFGLKTHKGTVTIAPGSENIKTLTPSYPGTLEYYLYSSGIPIFALDLKNSPNVFSNPKTLFRSIGAKDSRPQYYQGINFKKYFDAVFFIDETTNTRLLTRN